MKHWIIVADVSGARIFSIADRYAGLKFVQSFENTQGRLRNHELVTDGAGRLNKAGAPGTRSATDPRLTAHDDIASRFTHELAEFLRKEFLAECFDSFSLIAPPHFLGAIRPLLGKELEQELKGTLHHDLMHVTAHELHGHIEPLLNTPGLFLS